jgi:hypothetical protein
MVEGARGLASNRRKQAALADEQAKIDAADAP